MGKKVVAKILVVLMLAMTIVTNVPGNTAKAAWNAYYFGNLTYGSLGTFLAGTFWHWFGWSGVVGTGIALTACSLVINIRAKK